MLHHLTRQSLSQSRYLYLANKTSRMIFDRKVTYFSSDTGNGGNWDLLKFSEASSRRRLFTAGWFHTQAENSC